MTRYFIAIPFADDTKECLLATQPQACPGVRRIEADELHLTLHFLGALVPPADACVRAALSGLKLPKFPITLRGVGTFQGQADSRVLWAGVESNEQLSILHGDISRLLSDGIRFRPETRPYTPHVTLARLNAPVAQEVIQRFVNEHRSFHLPNVLVERFALYSSEMNNDRPVYRCVSQYDLLSDLD